MVAKGSTILRRECLLCEGNPKLDPILTEVVDAVLFTKINHSNFSMEDFKTFNVEFNNRRTTDSGYIYGVSAKVYDLILFVGISNWIDEVRI